MQAERWLRPGAALVVISFHSLEDRMVKDFLRGCQSQGNPTFRPSHKRVIRPTEEEIALNPRSRSAKMRVIQRTAAPAPPPSKFPSPFVGRYIRDISKAQRLR